MELWKNLMMCLEERRKAERELQRSEEQYPLTEISPQTSDGKADGYVTRI
jgi:hypothetical protein